MTVPPSGRNTGFSLASDAGDVASRIVSSRPSSTPGTATTSASYAPSRHARAAFSWLANAKASCWSRVMPCLSAISSAPSPSETVHCGGMSGLVIRQPRVVEYICWLPAGKARSGFWSTQGARLIDSTPPATATDASPSAMARYACTTASSPEAHSRLTVAPGTVTGSPASSTAIRATFRFSSPAPLALPNTTSSRRAGSRPGERSTSDRRTCAARSSGRTEESAPPYLPTGVRTASTM